MTGERVFEALTDCADELEGEIVARYVHADGVHPAMQHKYDRDMQTVIDARTAITTLRAQVAALAGEKAEYPSDIPDVPRVIWDALNEVDPDWTGSMIEGDVRDSEHAAVAIRQLRTPTAAVIGQCRACRFAITEGDVEMECERMSRVQHIGSLSNGTACATPYEGCSAVLEVTPDFGCVLWEARKDGV